MKYIVLVPDGAYDYPLDELEGKTPLEVAKTPGMDHIAKSGIVGTATTIPGGFTPASDVANLSILGYDPDKYYSGRGPLEAANMGVDIKQGDVAFRCNLVTIDDDVMVDYSAGHIKDKEAAELIRALDKELGSEKLNFYPGVSYRHLMVTRDKSLAKALLKTKTVAPHDILNQKASKNYPKGPGRKYLIDLMEKAKEILPGREVNNVRIDLGENPADAIWLWGQGTNPKMPKFKDRFGVEGSIISAVNLVKGIGKIIGLKPIDVPGATGYYDTNYKGKAEYALNSLEEGDFVYIHVEAPDEAGHNADIRAKITALENFDRHIVQAVLERMKQKNEPFRIMLLADHYTPVKVRTHTAEPIFFAMCGEGIAADEIDAFNEAAAVKARPAFKKGSDLMRRFIG